MENWQLTLVILASVSVGALIPVLVTMATAFYRTGREIAAIGPQLTRTMGHVEAISDRVETLSRGLQGGESDIAALLTSVGDLARRLERNMKTFDVFAAILASVVPVIAVFFQSWFQSEGTGKPHTPDIAAVPGNGASPSGTAAPPETKIDTH